MMMMMMMMTIIIIVIIIIIIIIIITTTTTTTTEGDINIIKEQTEKFLKYGDPTIEIKRMWNLKANVIKIITEATGTISKLLRQYLKNIPGKH